MADADDVIKGASRFFSKLGSTLKQTSKQVTGLGRGEVRLELDQTRIAPGGTLRGRVVLVLPERVDAKRLVVTLRAHQRMIEITRRDGERTSATTKKELFSFDLALGAAESYEARTLPFELPLPADALDLQPPSPVQHPLADVARSVASVFSPKAGPVEWSVTARLDIAWGRDLTSTVDIIVAR